MAHTASDMMWLNDLLRELGFCKDGTMSIYCDNQATIYS